MGKIKQLPEEVAIKIAAGEVVERPASVVKELVENSIDAGATKIEITLENGGKSLISVCDDGSGMDRSDAEKAFLRHGTSKIKSVDDLLQVVTLGFRGEALAAIAASSEVTLITSLSRSNEGTEVKAKNAAVDSVKPHAPLPGTTITVSELFSSIPARQKFLKSDTTEWKSTLETIIKQMITHPEIAFVVTHNNRSVYNLPSNQTFIERVAAIWKLEPEKFLAVNKESPHLSVAGAIALPQIAHASMPGTKGRQYLSVNHHPIQDKAMARAIKDAYGTLLPPGMQPVYALALSIHPGMVDVNIHPRKDEVRFVNPQEVFRFLLASVSLTLDQNNLAFQSIETGESPQKISHSPNLDKKSEIIENSSFKNSEGGRGESEISLPPDRNSFPIPLSSFDPQGGGVLKKFSLPDSASPALPGGLGLEKNLPAELISPATPQWGILASQNNSIQEFDIYPSLVFDSCFIITTQHHQVYIIDQHAAHERILYHKLWKQENGKQIERQKLLIPIPLEINETDKARLADQAEVFTKIGFDFREENNTFLLTEVPHLLKEIKASRFFHEVLTSLDDDRPEPELKDFKHKLFATMACKAAVKAGDKLDTKQINRLISDLLSLPDRYTCPHGRPSYITFSPNDFDKMFKRTGF